MVGGRRHGTDAGTGQRHLEEERYEDDAAEGPEDHATSLN
jgi:hypothetical protein